MTQVARTSARRAILRRAIVAWGAAFVLALGSAAITYSFASEYDQAIRGFAEESRMQVLLGDVLQLMVDGQAAQRGYALTGDPAFLQSYLASDGELPETLGELNSWLGKRGEDDEARALEEAIRSRDEFTRSVMALVREGRLDAARERIGTGEGRRQMDRVRTLARALERRREASIDALASRIEHARARTGVALGFGGLLTLLIAVSALVTVRRDLHGMDAAARALEDGERRFRLIAESASDLIRIHERGGRAIYASPSSRRLLGYTPEELVEMDPDGLVPEEDRARLCAAVDALLVQGEPPPAIVHRLQHRGGGVRWFETRVEAIQDEDGVLRRYHSASRDVTARVETERESREVQAELVREAEQLREISHRDELTGLLNRRGLLELGARVLASARDDRTTVVAYFVDLDGLKEINDRLGHDEGDCAIADAARLLRDAARASDLVARLGGDELVVLGSVRDGSAAGAFGKRIDEHVARHNATARRPYRISMSVGFATWSPQGGERSVDDLIADADAAMYEHKRSRRTTTRSGEPIVRDPAE